MMRYKLAALFTVLVQCALLALSGCSSRLDSDKFLAKAMQDGIWEIQASHLALQRSSDPDVKKFAVRMIEDHARIDQEIAELAKISGAKLPQEITADQKIKFDDMSKLSGHDFDKRFMHFNVNDHEREVKDFSNQAEKGTDVGVKAFAARTLPTLKEHLQLAKGVYTKVQP
jgi:putative membrane protein